MVREQSVESFYTRLRQSVSASSSSPLLIFPSTSDADSLCALKIIFHLLESDSVRYACYPVSSFDEIHNFTGPDLCNSTSSDTEPISILLVNWGCHGDLRVLNLGSAARVFVVDSHRPIHLHNISDENDRVIVLYTRDDEHQADLACDFDVSALANASVLDGDDEYEGGGSDSEDGDNESEDGGDDGDDNAGGGRRKRRQDCMATKMKTWSENGMKKLTLLLARMGFALIDCQQKFRYMNLEVKPKMKDEFERFLPEYGLNDFYYRSFMRLHGYSTKVSAADVVYGVTVLLESFVKSDGSCASKKFGEAYDALSMNTANKLKTGMQYAIKIQRAILRQGSSAITKRGSIQSGRKFRWVKLEDSSDTTLLGYPQALTKFYYFLMH